MERKLVIGFLIALLGSCAYKFSKIVDHDYGFNDQVKRNIVLRLHDDGSFILANRVEGALKFSTFGSWSKLNDFAIEISGDFDCPGQKIEPYRVNEEIDYAKAMDNRGYIFPCLWNDTIVVDREKDILYLKGFAFSRK